MASPQLPSELLSDEIVSAEDGVEFFERVQCAFLEAQQKSGAHSERHFRIAGFNLCLRFANSSLDDRICPAFEHGSTELCSPPDLTVCLWDSSSTGTEMPPPPWAAEDFGMRNQIRGTNLGRIRTAFHMGSGVHSLLDLERNLAIFWIRDANELPIYESGAPLLTILYWWMKEHGRQLIHAAAIGTAAGGVLLVGKGGSGKSSTALRALTSDLFYVGDDYCLVSNDTVPFVHSLYSSGKIHTKDIEQFPFLQPALDKSYNLNNEKALFFLNDTFSERMSTGFPIRAVLCPVVAGRSTTQLHKISPSACLLALAPSTIFQLPGAGLQEFQFLSELARSVPAYALELGTDFSHIPRIIADFLAELPHVA